MGEPNGEMGDKSDVPALLKALKDVDGHVIDAAVSALSKLKLDERAFKPLEEALNGYPERVWGKTVGQIAVILGEIGDKRAVKPLTRIMGLGQVPFFPWSYADDYINVRALAQEALVHIHADNVPDLIELLKDGDWNMRCLVARALGKIGNKSAVSALIEVLKDDEHVRWRAAEALGKTGDKSAIPALSNVLNDKNRLVREHATRALKKLGE